MPDTIFNNEIKIFIHILFANIIREINKQLIRRNFSYKKNSFCYHHTQISINFSIKQRIIFI